MTRRSLARGVLAGGFGALALLVMVLSLIFSDRGDSSSIVLMDRPTGVTPSATSPDRTLPSDHGVSLNPRNSGPAVPNHASLAPVVPRCQTPPEVDIDGRQLANVWLPDDGVRQEANAWVVFRGGHVSLHGFADRGEAWFRIPGARVLRVERDGQHCSAWLDEPDVVRIEVTGHIGSMWATGCNERVRVDPRGVAEIRTFMVVCQVHLQRLDGDSVLVHIPPRDVEPPGVVRFAAPESELGRLPFVLDTDQRVLKVIAWHEAARQFRVGDHVQFASQPVWSDDLALGPIGDRTVITVTTRSGDRRHVELEYQHSPTPLPEYEEQR